MGIAGHFVYFVQRQQANMADSLHWADYFIFVLFLSISLGIGVFHALTGGRQRTTSEFIMANRKLKVLPTVLSMTMSYMSAITILGQVSEIYDYGIQQAVWFTISSIFAGALIEMFIVPWLFPLKLVTAYQVSDIICNSFCD